MPPNQLAYETVATPGIWRIFSLYESGRENMSDTAFLVTSLEAEELSAPEYQAPTTVRKRPKASIATVMPKMVSPVLSLWRKAFLASSLVICIQETLFEMPDD